LYVHRAPFPSRAAPFLFVSSSRSASEHRLFPDAVGFQARIMVSSSVTRLREFARARKGWWRNVGFLRVPDSYQRRESGARHTLLRDTKKPCSDSHLHLLPRARRGRAQFLHASRLRFVVILRRARISRRGARLSVLKPVRPRRPSFRLEVVRSSRGPPRSRRPGSEGLPAQAGGSFGRQHDREGRDMERSAALWQSRWNRGGLLVRAAPAASLKVTRSGRCAGLDQRSRPERSRR